MESMTDTENTSAAAQNEPIVATAATREFVKKAAEAAKERATTLHASAQKATNSVEQTIVNTVGVVAKLTRQAHQATYEDAEAFFSGVDQLASAKCLGEAVQIYVDYLQSRTDLAVARTRAATAHVGKLLSDSAKTVQENVATTAVFPRKAA
jgi:hypothetical protein